MARRRHEVADAARRRRRILLIAAACVAGVGAAAFGLLRSPLLDVDRVLVAGSNSVDRDQVVETSGVGRGDAMVDVDAAAVRSAVMGLPGVASARVELDWPGTVRISVTDERPLAVLGEGDRRLLVGRGGRVIESLSSDAVLPLTLVTAQDPALLDGLVPGASVPDSLMPVVVIVEQVAEPLRSRLGGIDVATDGTLTLRLTPGEGDPAAGDGDRTDGGVVELGRPEDVPTKLLAVASMLAAANMRCLDVLDVSEPLRPTISRRAGCDPGPPTVGTTTTAPTTTLPKGSGATTSKGAGQPTRKGAGEATTSTPEAGTSSSSTGGRG